MPVLDNIITMTTLALLIDVDCTYLRCQTVLAVLICILLSYIIINFITTQQFPLSDSIFHLKGNCSFGQNLLLFSLLSLQRKVRVFTAQRLRAADIATLHATYLIGVLLPSLWGIAGIE